MRLVGIMEEWNSGIGRFYSVTKNIGDAHKIISYLTSCLIYVLIAYIMPRKSRIDAPGAMHHIAREKYLNQR